MNEAVLHLLETLGLSQATPSMIEKVCAQGGTYTVDKRLLFPRRSGSADRGRGAP